MEGSSIKVPEEYKTLLDDITKSIKKSSKVSKELKS